MNYPLKLTTNNDDTFKVKFAGIALVFALLWVYWPGLGVAYDYHDAFYSYAYENKSCGAHPQWIYFLYTGKSLFSVIHCLTVESVIYELKDTIIVRAFTFFTLVLSAIWMLFIIRSMGYGLLSATIVALGVSTLPGIQLFLNLTQAYPVFLTIPLVLLSIHLFKKGKNYFLSVFSFRGNRLRIIFFVFLASTPLLISSLIYQQTSSLFFLFICLLCLSPKSHYQLKDAFILLGFGILVYGLHGLVYLLIHNYIVLPYALLLMGKTLEQVQGLPFHVAVSYDFLGKIEFLFTDLLSKGLRLWSIDYVHPITQIILILFPVGMIAWCVSKIKESKVNLLDGNYKKVLILVFGYFLVISVCLILTNAPNLIAKSSSLTGRHVIPFQGLIIVVICVGITQFATHGLSKNFNNTIFVSIVVLFIGTGVMQARQNFDLNMAGLAQKEMTYIRNSLVPRMHDLPSRIIVIQPHVTSLALANDFTDTHDENGKLTTNYPQDVPWIVLAAFLDLGGQRSQFPQVEVLECCSPIPDVSSEDLIIDMRVLAQEILHKRIGFLGTYYPE